MLWIGSTLFVAFGPPLGEFQNGPTAIELAVAGVITFIGYEILVRPKHARGDQITRMREIARPQAAERTAPPKRRVA